MRRLGTILLATLLLLLSVGYAAAIDEADSPIDDIDEGVFSEILGEDSPLEQTDESDSAVVRIIPDSGEQGDTHVILVSNLTAAQNVTLRIVEAATGAEAYNTTRTANDNGRFQVEIFTTTADAPGSDTVIGSGTFTIEEPVDMQGSISIAPQSAAAGAIYVISVADVEPFADLEIRVEDDDEAQEIFSTRIRATVDGTAIVEFESDSSTAAGTYPVLVLDADGNEVASGEIIIRQGMREGPPATSATESDAVTVTITPQNVGQGDNLVVAVAGLEANSEFDLEIQLDSTGETVYATTRSADATGQFSLPLSTSEEDSPGNYTVNVLVDGAVVASSSVIIEGDESAPPGDADSADSADEITLQIAPEEIEAGEFVTLIANGLNPNEDVIIRITYQGEVVISEPATSDENGIVALSLPTEVSAPAGEYHLEILRASELLVEGQYTLVGSTVEVVITPESGDPDSTYYVAVSGLPADAAAQVEFLQDDQVVLTKEIISDVNGNAVLSVNGDANLETGTYDVRVIQNGVALAETVIAVGVDLPNDDDVAQNDDSAQVSDVSISIEPQAGAVGTSHQITVEGLAPNSSITLNIAYDDEVIFSTTATANQDGVVERAIVSEEGDSTGTYTVEVVQNNEMIASSNFIVDNEVTQDEQPPSSDSNADTVSLVIEPAQGPAGTSHVVTVNGLEPNETITLDVIFDGETVFSTDRTADASGQAVLNLASEEGDPVGTYEIRATRDGTEIASSDFVIGDDVASGETQDDSTQPEETQDDTQDEAQAAVEPGEVSVRIEPAQGPIGTSHTVTIEGLEAGENVTIDVVYQGETNFTTQRTADPTGKIILDLAASEGDPTGTYTVHVVRDGSVVASNDLIVGDDVASGSTQQDESPTEEQDSQPQTAPPTSDGEVSVTVDPQSGPLTAPHTVVIDNLEPRQVVTINVLYDGEINFTTDRIAGESGRIVLNLAAEASDPEGEYTIEVVQDGSVIASGSWIAGASAPQSTQPDAPSTTGNVEVNISPDQGPAGTSYVITVNGLQSGETVTLELLFQGTPVFNAQRAADSNGSIQITLTSSESDPQGRYNFRVQRDDTVLAQADLIVGTAESAQPDAPATTPDDISIRVVPNSGPIGTVHDIQISGLNPNENVNVDVRYDGASVFNTDRAADDDGNIQILLTSEQDDPAGTYTVVVQRDGTTIAQDDFVVQGADTTPDTTTPDEPATGDSDVVVSIQPNSGPVGTTHDITVSGLDANENVTLDVLFNGETVFNTQREADAEGVIQLSLNSEEGDPSGTYSVQVRRDGTTVAQDDFVVQGADTAPDTTTPDEPATTAEVQVDVTPQSGPIGTMHDISISGLNPDETVSVDVLRNGAAVFSTEATADATGIATLSLSSEEGDPAGDYTINVIRNDEVIGSGILSIAADTAQAPETNQQPATPQTSDSSRFFEGRLDDGTPIRQFSFEGQAGESVLITLTASDFDPVLTLLDRDNIELAFSDDSGGSLNSQIGPFVLPYTGSYRLVVNSFDFSNFGNVTEGDFTLTVETVVARDVAYGQTSTVQLSNEAYSEFLNFEAATGDVISVSVDSNSSIDTRISVIDPNGFTAISDDDSGAGFDPEILRYVITTPGTYTLTVSAFSPGDSGSASVTIERSDVRNLDAEARTIVLNSKQASDALTLQGSAGEEIQLSLDLISGDPQDLSVTVLQDGMQLMGYTTMGIPDEMVLGFFVPEDGDVTIIVAHFGSDESVLEFSAIRQP